MPGINGFREARLGGVSGLFVGRFRESKLARAAASRELSLVSELPKYVLEIGFVVGLGIVAAVLFSTNTPTEATSIIGVLAAGATRALPTVNRLVAGLGQIRAGQVGLRNLTADIERLDRDGFQTEAAPTRSFIGDIVLNHVDFHFPDSDGPVLRDVSTVIEEGRTTAFVGSSGAGKSTLLDIVLGLLTPTSGTVTSGGVDIQSDLASWYAGLGVVPQDVFLLDDTLVANIAFGVPPEEVDAGRLRHAVSLAQLDGLLADLPEGLETRMGERGVRLSGGQRQRVGIARALYRQPRLLVLDEATSALDNATEHRITETIEELSGRMTIIVVAHRLSTVRNADRVIFMSAGEIASEGTFTEVEADNHEFAHLVALGKL